MPSPRMRKHQRLNARLVVPQRAEGLQVLRRVQSNTPIPPADRTRAPVVPDRDAGVAGVLCSVGSGGGVGASGLGGRLDESGWNAKKDTEDHEGIDTHIQVIPPD